MFLMQRVIKFLPKYLKLKLGLYKYTWLNCIELDRNHAYGTNGIIRGPFRAFGIAEYGYRHRSAGLTISPLSSLWKIVAEQNQLWIMVF